MKSEARLKEIAKLMRNLADELDDQPTHTVRIGIPSERVFWIRDRNGTEVPHLNDKNVVLHQARNPGWKEQNNYLSVVFQSNRDGSDKQYRVSCWDTRLQDVIKQAIDNKTALELFIKPTEKGWLNVVGVATK